MRSLFSRRLAIVATALIVLGGGTVAVAATRGSSHSGRQTYLDDVAKHLNVAPQALTAAVQAARSEEIKAAVADGRLTQAQANALEQRVQRRGLGLFGSGHGAGRHGNAAAVLSYLGIDAATLRSDRRAGKSLAQIAAATPGKSVAGLKAALLSADRARLARAVASGAITSAQEQHRLALLASRVEAQLQRTGAPLHAAGGGKGLGL